MPAKKNAFKKFNKKSRMSRPKQGSNRQMVMVNRNPLKDHTIVAERFITKVAASFVGYLPAATNTELGFSIFGNSFFQPFNTSATVVAAGFTASDGSSATIAPAGYTALSTLYRYYRIYGSRIKITLQPQSAADVYNLTVYPATTSNPSNTSTSSMNNQYARTKVISSGNNVKENTIVHYMDSHQILGMTKRQFADQLNIIITAAPTLSLDWYWNIQCPLLSSTASNTAIVSISIEVDFFIELSDPILQAP